MAQIHIEDESKEEPIIVVDETLRGSDYNLDSWEEDFKFEIDVEATIQYNAYVKNEIEKNYPIRYVLAHSILMIVLNVTLIVMQVIATVNNAAFSELGLAFWVGIYNLVIAAQAILTIRYRNKTLISWTATMHLFGMMLSFAGFIFVNMIAWYNYNCVVATYYRHCYNVSIKPIHLVFICLGTPSAILCLIFFIYFKLKIRVGRPM